MAGLQSIVRDKAGNAIATATVTVYDTGTTNLSVIWEDVARTVPQLNPFTAASSGFYSFYAEPAVYDIKYEKQGFQDRTLEGVELSVGSSDFIHGNLLGLTADDHLQYLIRTGIRPMTGDLDMGENDITDLTKLSGPDTGGAARPGLEMTEGVGPEMRLDFNEANLAGTPLMKLSSDGVSITDALDMASAPGVDQPIINAQGITSFVDIGGGNPFVLGAGTDIILFANSGAGAVGKISLQDNATPLLVLDGPGGLSNFETLWPEIDAALGAPPNPRSIATKDYVDTAIDAQAAFSAFPNTGPDSIPNGGGPVALTNFLLNNGGHSFNAGNLVIGTTGFYVFQVSYDFASNAVGSRGIELFEGINQVSQTMIDAASTNDTRLTGVSFARQYLAGDEISMVVFQDSGAPLNGNLGNQLSFLNGIRVG